MKWFKFYGQDYLSDPKMLSLTASERSCWITLLAYSSVNDNGMITFMSEEQLMTQAGISPNHEEWEYTQGILEKLKKLNMITIDNGMITIKNWKKRQETNLTSYERVKRFREKKRNDNTTITTDKNRIDKNRIDSKRETPSQDNESFFKGEDKYKELLTLFSNENNRSMMEEEFKKFILYWTEPNKSGSMTRWQQQSTFDVKRRLYTWLSKMKEFKSNKNQPNYVL